jgi:PAS domain S-box-containing protein
MRRSSRIIVKAWPMVPRRLLADIRNSPRYLIELAAVALVYFAVAKLSLTLASIHPSATPIWPPTGLALSAVLLLGYRIWPAIFVGALLVNLITAGSIYTSCAIGFGNTLEAVLGGWLINRWSGGPNTFDTPIGIAKFTLISLGPSTMTSATIGVGSLSLAGYADASSFASIWMTWWLGDLAGALVMTPLIVLWRTPPSLDRHALSRTAAIIATTIAVGILAFSPLIEQTANRAPLAFLAVLPLIWAALRSGPRDTAAVAFILACFAVWGTVLRGGPFARIDMNDSFLLVLAFMISITVPSLALSADVAMRRSAEDRERFVHELSDQLRRIADPDAIMIRVAGAIGRYLDASRAGYSEIDEMAHIIARAQWHAPHLSDVTGRFPLQAFGAVALDQLVRGETRAADDTEADPRNEAFFPAYRSIQARAHITVPLMKEGRLQAALHVCQERPRHWTAAEVALCEQLAERTWAAVERARAEAAMSKEIAERKRHEERLRETVEELDRSNRQLLEHARVLELANVLVRNTQDEITLWNEGARRLYGWKKDEAIGKVSHQLLRTEFSLPMEQIKQTLLRDGSWDGELVQYTKAGEQVVSQSHWELHRDAHGSPLGIVETNTDITERKRYEEHFQFIMRELSHRSKNLLAVVQSIARQIALRTETFAEFQAAFAARIDALVEIHNLLVAGAWRGVEIHDLIRVQLSPFLATKEDRLELAGPAITLTPTAAEQIGLALHELATNAAKHGALSALSGKVRVQWELENNGPDGETLRFCWREHGGPAVTAPARQGFGHLVITKAVPATLQGKARLEFLEAGVEWTLVAPVPNMVVGSVMASA